MSKQDTPNDGFVPKVLVGSIVVIWVSLVGGSWLGRYAVEKGYLGKNEATEFKQMPAQRPRPWVTVDPRQVDEIDSSQTPESVAPSTPEAADTESATPAEVITSTPVEQATPDVDVPPAATPQLGSPTPAAPPRPTPGIVETPTDPSPTPALSGSTYQLQFGSFGTQENAQKMVDDLTKLGQTASVEELNIEGKKSYRVRGGVYTEDQARAQRDKLVEQNIKVYIVNTE